uniref:GH16 domain-containing protein n=1 Tax=Acrobeloides nanus TaxID=290746 RepID=A0A914CM93_9BILA
MPVGPGTWPAWWTTNTPWPDMGEIDIIEGIGGNTWNTITLHTRDGCHMRDKDAIYFTGTWAKGDNGAVNATNCYINAPSNFYFEIMTIRESKKSRNWGKNLETLEESEN